MTTAIGIMNQKSKIEYWKSFRLRFWYLITNLVALDFSGFPSIFYLRGGRGCQTNSCGLEKAL